MWTKADIIELLKTNNHAVERAIVAIYNNQTQDEKDRIMHTSALGLQSVFCGLGDITGVIALH
jgi:hypothetical protein